MMAPRHLTVFLFVFAILLRISLLPYSFYGDEWDWIMPASTLTDNGGAIKFTSLGDDPLFEPWRIHPPLGIVLYHAASFLPLSDEARFRFVPVFCSIATLVVMYLIARRRFDESAAWYALLIATFSTYHLYHSSLRIDVDGGILTFLVVSALYTYSVWCENRSDAYLWLTALFLSLSVLTRLSAGVFVAFFALHAFGCHRRMDGVRLGLGSVALPILLGAFLLSIGHADYLSSMLAHGVPHKSSGSLSSFFSDRLVGAYTITRGLTPPLFVLLTLAVFRSRTQTKKDHQSTQSLLLFFVLIVLVFAILPPDGEKQRYFTPALPAVFILVGHHLSLQAIKKHLTPAIASFVAFSMIYTLWPPYDHLLHEYLLYQNLVPILAWTMPFFLLFATRDTRLPAVLLGCYLAFSASFVLYDCSANKAYSDSVSQLRFVSDAYVTGRVEVTSSLQRYDWWDDRCINNGVVYGRLISYGQLRTFDARSDCVKIKRFNYPLAYVCPKIHGN